MKKNDFSFVENLLGAYFHQDWGCLFGGWKDCVIDAAGGNSIVWEQRLHDQIGAILANLSDAEIEAFFYDSHADIDVPYDAGMNHRSFLQEVQRLISEDIVRRTGEP